MLISNKTLRVRIVGHNLCAKDALAMIFSERGTKFFDQKYQGSQTYATSSGA